MTIFLYPSFITLTSYTILEIFMKKKLGIKTYALIFLLLTATSYLRSDENDRYFSYENMEGLECKLSDSQRSDMRRMGEAHLKCAYIDLNNAKAKSIILPDVFAQKFTNLTISAFIASLPAKDPKSKAIIALIVVLQDYLNGVYEEWKQINRLLNSAKYNLEMSEFYCDALLRDETFQPNRHQKI